MVFRRYVALGDSFTEGVGDADPTRPNGLRGWADRVAEALAAQTEDFGYANLAIRGRKLPQIIAEQVERALDLEPDLVTIHGGGNDVLRPSVDVDELAASYDETVGRLAATGAAVVMFTLGDTRSNQAFKVVRGRVALYNEWIREIADRHDARLVDLWRDHDYDRRHLLDADRLHYSPAGHQAVAIRVLEALGVLHGLEPHPAPPPVALTAPERRAEHLEWTRTFLLPWVQRRLTGRSSGDGVAPKYADLTSLPTPARR